MPDSRSDTTTAAVMPDGLIFKVSGTDAWNSARSAGRFLGSDDDRRDGYIHFSTAAQLPGTLAKHYTNRADLILVAVDVRRLGHALRWEAARDGSLFPHLYRDLLMSDVLWERPLALDADGRHRLPEGVA